MEQTLAGGSHGLECLPLRQKKGARAGHLSSVLDAGELVAFGDQEAEVAEVLASRAGDH
jgi:hypothetical protein